MEKDFFTSYMEYVGHSESPTIYHRWAMLSGIGALLGRNVWIPFGHMTIYPNQYILLMGTAGARKASPLNIIKTLLQEAGYKRFSPAKTSKECLLSVMSAPSDILLLEEELELLVDETPNEIFVCKGEFIDFIGFNDTAFTTLLTDLWDNLPDYDNPKISRKSVKVYKPTISILGGATPHSIAMAIPPESLELGFTSRIIFVFSEPTGTKIAWPHPPCKDKKEFLVNRLREIKAMRGVVEFSQEAREILSEMYSKFVPIEDGRFSKYSARRYDHLLKLCLIHAIVEGRMEVIKEDCIKSNTVLNAAEKRMSKALGEFGKSKYSNVSNMIIEHLSHALKPVTMTELWKLVAKDLSKVVELGDIMKNLTHSEKVQVVTLKDRQGYLLKHQESKSWASHLIDENYLTLEER